MRVCLVVNESVLLSKDTKQGPIADVHLLRTLVKFVIVRRPGGTRTRFAHLTCGHSAAPLLPARVNVIDCEVVDLGEVDGVFPMKLRYIKQDVIRTEAELTFFRGVDVGMLAHFQLDDWADELMSDSSIADPLVSVRM